MWGHTCRNVIFHLTQIFFFDLRLYHNLQFEYRLFTNLFKNDRDFVYMTYNFSRNMYELLLNLKGSFFILLIDLYMFMES